MTKQTIEQDLWDEFQKEVNKKIDFSKLKVIIPKDIDHTEFWEKFLTADFESGEFPPGAINRTLEKNFAIYIIQNNLDLEQIKERYTAQGRSVAPLLGWIKKVNAGEILEYNVAELTKWCIENNEDLLPILSPTNIQDRKDYTLVWEKDLKNIQDADYDWIIKDLIPPKSVGVWTGKRGTYKTFLVLASTVCIANNKTFIGKYPVKQKKVLYLDKENGTGIIKQRMLMLKKGMEIEEDIDVGFICFSQLRIDIPEYIAELEKMIVEHDIGVLVVDTYRRAIGFDENNAGDVSHLFVSILRPLVEKHDLTIILIHHDKKGYDSDEMDSIRGSSDLANYSDFILKNERKGKRLILKQLKCRNAPEIEPVEISIETDDVNFIRFNGMGTYEPQTVESRAVEVLTIWIAEKKIKSFKTKEAQQVALSNGITKQIFFNALDSLQSVGVISKCVRGVYNVV